MKHLKFMQQFTAASLEEKMRLCDQENAAFIKGLKQAHRLISDGNNSENNLHCQESEQSLEQSMSNEIFKRSNEGPEETNQRFIDNSMNSFEQIKASKNESAQDDDQNNEHNQFLERPLNFDQSTTYRGSYSSQIEAQDFEDAQFFQTPNCCPEGAFDNIKLKECDQCVLEDFRVQIHIEDKASPIELSYVKDLVSTNSSSSYVNSLSNFSSFNENYRQNDRKMQAQGKEKQFAALLQEIQLKSQRLLSEKGIESIISQIKDQLIKHEHYKADQQFQRVSESNALREVDINCQNMDCSLEDFHNNNLNFNKRAEHQKIVKSNLNKSVQGNTGCLQKPKKQGPSKKPLQTKKKSRFKSKETSYKVLMSHNHSHKNTDNEKVYLVTEKENHTKGDTNQTTKTLKLILKDKSLNLKYKDNSDIDRFCAQNNIKPKQKAQILDGIQSQKPIVSLV